MNKLTLVIGNKNYSSWSLRAWLAARKSGLPFDEVNLSLLQPAFDNQIGDYTRAGRVPVLMVDGVSVWDSLAICEYLNECADHRLWPAERMARAHARSACAEMHSGFDSLRSALPMNCRAQGRKVEVGKALKRDIDRIMSVWGEARERFGNGGGWLYGAFSIADAFYAPVVFRFKTYDVPIDAVAHRYMDHLLADADVQKWAADADQESEILEEDEAGV